MLMLGPPAPRQVEDLRGSPLSVGTLEEMIDDNHAIVSSSVGPEYYVGVLSFVNQDLLEPGCTVLLHNKVRWLQRGPHRSYTAPNCLQYEARQVAVHLLTLCFVPFRRRFRCRRWWASCRTTRTPWSRSCVSRRRRSSRTPTSADSSRRSRCAPHLQTPFTSWILASPGTESQQRGAAGHELMSLTPVLLHS